MPASRSSMCTSSGEIAAGPVSVTDGSLADMGLDGDQMTADPDDDDAGHFRERT
jgi:hypothetical protein